VKAATNQATLADWTARPRAARSPLLDAALAAAADKRPADEAELAATLTLLEELGVDAETLAAAIFYACGSAPPPALAGLVEGQREAEKVWSLHRSHHGAPEGLRRLLLAMVRDLRVVFILLARQLARMRAAAKAAPEHRHALAELTADIHAPLANRLGIWQLKWELEDLAFRYLQPDTYKRIAKLLDERREDRERFIGTAIAKLRTALAEAGIAADIAGRPKHIFSIWKKMQRKNVDFEHLYDVRALRVLVQDLGACYAALGVVHGLWPNVPGEFDDYIARPKGNHYQSLHTAVVGPEGKTLEVQIRTEEMHDHAELGVAAHWRYKEGGAGDAAFERKVAWMRQLLENKGDADNDAALMAGLKTELVDDRVYLLTPQGKVLDLPTASTVLDFAYHVHTDVGHKCRGAKVNGRIVTLTHMPASGDTVEILTGKVAEPKRDWIVAERGYLHSARAREKVRAWFKRAEHEHNVTAGRELVERELKRLALPDVPLDALAERFKLKGADELYVAVGVGEVSVSQIARALHELASPEPAKPLISAEPVKRRRSDRDSVVIDGVGNLMTQLARCCQPLPGDAIVGYLTRGKGVSVHRAGCRSLAALVAREPERVVHVAWGGQSGAYEVEIHVQAYDRKNLLKDVSAAISGADAHVIAASTRLDPDHGTAEMRFVLRVSDFAQLSGLLNKVGALPNVIEARRAATAPKPPTRSAKAT
jgi:GTP pyrophosphokinase